MVCPFPLHAPLSAALRSLALRKFLDVVGDLFAISGTPTSWADTSRVAPDGRPGARVEVLQALLTPVPPTRA